MNEVPTWRIDPMPYGGVKQSGFGREGLKYAIEEMTEPKLLVLNLCSESYKVLQLLSSEYSAMRANVKTLEPLLQLCYYLHCLLLSQARQSSASSSIDLPSTRS